MFKNYYGKTTTEQQQLLYVANGTQLILLSIQICGGETDGVLTLTKYNNNGETKQVAFEQKLTILANNPIVLQHKIILPTGYSFAIKGSIAGISVCLNGVLQLLQSDTNSTVLTPSQSN